ncbi:cyclic pyranopterin monophosphate synthase [Spirochaetia bacterium]|nr:cyclic pyranopterin monophosphate synthase [Spirochaetia bacterium]
MRSDAAELIRRLKGLPGIERVSLTTNGQLLSGMVQTLRDTGLDEITISLNTLKSDTYSRLTGQGELARTLAGIDAVFDAGWTTLKLNCVPLSAESRNDAVQIAALSRDRNIQTRFIEMMPIGAGISFPGISSTTVRNWLEAEYGPYTIHMDKLGHGPARYGRFKGFTGSIGFIAPLSEPFCECCNRIRLDCNGFIRSCLHQDTGTNLQPALVQADDAELEAAIRSAILNKPQGHRFSHTEPFRQAMFRIGG